MHGTPSKREPDAMWHAYLLRCIDGSTYTGIAIHVDARFSAHQRGHGGRYTRSHPVQEIIAAVPIGTRAQASAFEYRAKRWTLKRKLDFFHRFATDWRSYCSRADDHSQENMAMTQLQDALAIHESATKQLSIAVIGVWESVAQCAPTLADAILQSGLDESDAARWICFPIEELGGSPAQCIARGEANHVLAYVLRVTHGLPR